MVLQDPLHRVPGDLVTEVGKRTSDPRVTPLRILAGHSHREVSDLSECRGAPSTPSRTAVVLLGDQPSVPAKDRVRRDDAGHLHQLAPAKLLAAHRESPALVVCEPKRSRTKLLAEDAILLSEIVNHIFLVAIHQASNSEHEELQRMGGIARGYSAEMPGTDGPQRFPWPRPLFRTLRDLNLCTLHPFGSWKAFQSWSSGQIRVEGLCKNFLRGNVGAISESDIRAARLLPPSRAVDDLCEGVWTAGR